VEFETIVVDNSSTDGSAEMVRRSFGDVTLVANTENLGYAKGNNQGISVARGDLVLLLNPDTELKPRALDTLIGFMNDHPDAGAVACRLVGLDGRVQRSCRGFPHPYGIFFEYLRLSNLFPRSRIFGAYRMTYFDYMREAEVDQPMGACLMLARKALDEIGSLDEQFPIFFNEVDWCFRAKQRGWKIYFTPDAEILHLGGASTSLVRSAMAKESHRSLLKFYAKHYHGRINPVLYWLVVLAISINSVITAKPKGTMEKTSATDLSSSQ
jgi:GT2 family glycosyltransferase